VSSQRPSRYDIEQMCRRVMYILIHEMTTLQRREFDKHTIWEEARTLYFSEYGQDLRDTVFQELVNRQDIQDLGTTICITEQGASRPEYQPPEGLFLRRTKIHFKNEKDEENGFYQLLVSGMPAVSLENGRYLANFQQLKILRDKNIAYIPENVSTQ